MLWIAGIMAGILALCAAFVMLWRPFAFVLVRSGADRADYAARAENYRDGKFFNRHEVSLMREVPEGEKDTPLSHKAALPAGEVPTAAPAFDPAPDRKAVTFTWLGHSSLLLQMDGKNILWDPVLGDYTSPVSFAGVRRYSPVPVEPEELPDIDLVILSHDHYDHLDYATIRRLDSRVGRYIVPLGVEYRLRRFGVSADKIVNMAWWEEQTFGALTVGCAPAQHFTGRYLLDSARTLWCSYVFKTEDHILYFTGDTGYDDHFALIREKYGPMDLVFSDGAQYNLRWRSVHMFPEETLQAVRDLGAPYVVPIHWGAFCLSDHPWDDSAARLVKAAEGTDVTVVTPMIGQTVRLEELELYQDRWYEGVE